MFYTHCAIKQAVLVNIYKAKRKYYENFNYKQKLSLKKKRENELRKAYLV